MQQTHIRSIQNQDFIENLVTTLEIKDYKIEIQKILQKIEHIYGSI
jgi:hypothetical protein